MMEAIVGPERPSNPGDTWVFTILYSARQKTIGGEFKITYTTASCVPHASHANYTRGDPCRRGIGRA